jgi:C-terminal processing protease CtpA/Prc
MSYYGTLSMPQTMSLSIDPMRYQTIQQVQTDFSPRSDAGSVHISSPHAIKGLGIVFQKSNMHTGLQVNHLKPGGAAAISGKLRLGDVVLTIDGRQVYAGMSGDELSQIVQVRVYELALLLIHREHITITCPRK